MEVKTKILDVNSRWQCCNCGWVGTHNDSADKTPVINDMWMLVCPECGNKAEFYPVVEITFDYALKTIEPTKDFCSHCALCVNKVMCMSRSLCKYSDESPQVYYFRGVNSKTKQ